MYTSDGSITAIATGGSAPYTYTWAGGQSTSTISGLASGWYTVTATDAVGCTKSDPTYLGYDHLNDSCYCTVTGIVYHDVNGNCIQDNGETGIQNILVKNNNSVSNYNVKSHYWTNANGVYTFLLPSGNYNLQEVLQYKYPLSSCQANSNPVTLTASSGCSYSLNFANSINPLHDIHIWNFYCMLPVPGNNFVHWMALQNDGTVSEDSVQVGYAHDGQLTYAGSWGVPLAQPNSTLAPNWYANSAPVDTLDPGQSILTSLTYSVPTNIPIGTQLTIWDSATYAAPMSNWLNDYTPWNNVKTWHVNVVGPYDPNIKDVYPQGVGPQGYISSADTVLDYMIHFQNTGNWPATKVVVTDQLDPDLEWESLAPGFSNYTYTASMDNNGLVTFTFDNINLPPSAWSPIGSIGVFSYSIRTKKNLAQGTQFTNSAAIYFDYNAPIITNTTVNTLNDNVGYHSFSHTADKLLVYPNPTSDNCAVKITAAQASSARLQIFNLGGQLIHLSERSLAAGENTLQVNLAAIPDGLYIIRLTYADKMRYCKLSIVR